MAQHKIPTMAKQRKQRFMPTIVNGRTAVVPGRSTRIRQLHQVMPSGTHHPVSVLYTRLTLTTLAT
jgi:hypothetical protein